MEPGQKLAENDLEYQIIMKANDLLPEIEQDIKTVHHVHLLLLLLLLLGVRN